MSIVQQATKRLEELKRAGVAVPLAVADPAQDKANGRAAAEPPPAQSIDSSPAATIRRHSAESANVSRATLPPTSGHAAKDSRVTGTLDLERLERLGYLLPTSTRSMLAEEFRHIKRPLLRNARSKEPAATCPSQIMVTSALAGEGKTFFSINLAMSMAAEIDTSVLLIDADVIHPTVLQRLGIQEARGLLDVLKDPGLDVANLVLATNVPKLSILSAGTRNDRATGLLASNAMEALLAGLADHYPNHVIIFDAPPLLLTNEAKVLASRMGQVVLVVEASKTPRSVVSEAFAAVEHCPVVLSVLNKAAVPVGPLGYGYYTA